MQLQVLSPLPSRSAPPKAGGVGLRVLHGLLPPLFLPLRSFREILISDMMREFRGGNGGDRGRAWTKRQDRLVGDYLGPRDAPVDTLGGPGPQVCLPLLSTGGVLEISCNRSPSLALVGHLAGKTSFGILSVLLEEKWSANANNRAVK